MDITYMVVLLPFYSKRQAPNVPKRRTPGRQSSREPLSEAGMRYRLYHVGVYIGRMEKKMETTI